MRKNNISSLFILNEERRLMGVVTAQDCARLVEEGSRDLTSIICTACTTTHLDTPAQDLFIIMQDLGHPLAVVDDDNKLRGVIVRGSLIAALAERGGN